MGSKFSKLKSSFWSEDNSSSSSSSEDEAEGSMTFDDQTTPTSSSSADVIRGRGQVSTGAKRKLFPPTNEIPLLELAGQWESYDEVETSHPKRPKLNANLAHEDLSVERHFNTLSRRLQPQDFVMEGEIAQGGMANVYTGYCKALYGHKLALKVVYRGEGKYRSLDMYELAARSLYKEYRVLRSLRHENVVMALGFFSRPLRSATIVMELLSGDLYQTITQDNFPQHKARNLRYIGQLASGVEYLHLTGGLIHMDLKPENLLISSGDRLKIADFGFSIPVGYSLRQRHHTPNGGTEAYRAPELLKGYPFDSTVDIWSVGVICYEVVSGGQHPFYPEEESCVAGGSCPGGHSPPAQRQLALERMVQFSQGHLEMFQLQHQPPEIIQFLQKTLKLTRRARKTAAELREFIQWIDTQTNN